MPSSSTIVATALLLFIALAAGALYVFGIPSDVKRGLEQRAVETLGENSAAELVKDAIHQLPEDNRLNTKQEVDALKNSAR